MSQYKNLMSTKSVVIQQSNYKSNECEMCRYVTVLYFALVYWSLRQIPDFVASVIIRIMYNLNECKSLEYIDY